jgi:predicted permease
VFTTVAIASLALSMGIAAAVGAIVNSIRNPVTPYREPERLFWVNPAGEGASGAVTEWTKLRAMQLSAGAIEALAYTRGHYSMVQAGSDADEGHTRAVSANYFELLGVRAKSGRLFSPASQQADAGRSAVVSHFLWQRALASVPRNEWSVNIDGTPYAVVGVAPPEMSWGGDLALAWTLLPGALAASGDTLRGLASIVRLRPGVTTPQFGEQLRLAAAVLTAEHGNGRRAFRFLLRTAIPEPDLLRDVHYALIAGSIGILLIACANLSALVLARGLSRQGATAVRIALGAPRREAVMAILAECLVVAIAGVTIGLMLASWGVDIVRRFLPYRASIFGDLAARFDLRLVVLSAIGATLLAMIAGLWPGLRIARTDIISPLKSTGVAVTRSSRGAFRWLVVFEVTLALAVVVSSGLLVRSARRVASVEAGYDAARVVEGWIAPRAMRNAPPQDLASLFATLTARAARLPGAESSSWFASSSCCVATSALAGGGNRFSMGASSVVVGDGYFATMGIPLLSGRVFEAGDNRAQAAIVDERAARELWAGDDPVGQMVSVDTKRWGSRWVRVIGVVGSITSHINLQDPYATAGPRIYFSFDSVTGSRVVVVRARDGALPQVAAGLAALVRDLTPRGMHSHVAGHNAGVANAVRGQAFLAGSFVALAGLALLLCAIGLYAVLAFVVEHRSREIALRLALGASTSSLVREVSRDATIIVLGGTAVGAFVAMWVSQLVDPLIFNQYRIDALTLVVSEAIIAGVAIAACWIPVRRALRANPAEVLRAV